MPGSNAVCVQPYLTRIERLLAGMLTRKPVRLTDVSDVITEHLFDVDLGGNNLDVFLYETARKMIRYGHRRSWWMHRALVTMAARTGPRTPLGTC